MDAPVQGPEQHANRWRSYLRDCGTLLDFAATGIKSAG
jgi:flagellum-specific ATP synthase